MPLADLIDHGSRVLTVCNACRYCERSCPVFPAIERRLTFGQADLAYLASLCHNCGECLYACQYAPPHEFGIDVPRTLAEIRLATYEDYCWPRPLAAAFRHHSVATAIGLAGALTAVLFGAILSGSPEAFGRPDTAADFYAVVPHRVMVGLFGAVATFAAVAIVIGLARFWRDVSPAGSLPVSGGAAAALGDVLTLRHLQRDGVDCVSGEETRRPWRRWWHHCTFYGFLLCFASTSVAAVYHSALGWHAPYGYTSLPVVLGTLGGIGLVIGPAGLFLLKGQRDPALGDFSQRGLDESFIALLFLTSLTGLALLVLRHHALMGSLLVVHLGTVLALFVTLPYGKFVHGLYRAAALLKSAREASIELR